MDWTANREGRLPYSYEGFAQAKVFIFRKWCEHAAERGVQLPVDLSGSCKYGTLFMNRVFGGAIRGHYQHQYNVIGGRIVDLSHDAADVGNMRHPYLHEPEFFAVPEQQATLDCCLPRVDRWVVEFLLEIQAAHGA
ncbi:MAG: transcriptional regulator [Proteobacteria bacterium]|nr:transcriptional regulator [Pseudomonadota bacterium]